MENKLLLQNTQGYKIVLEWFKSKNILPFRFQEETWEHIINQRSGLVNAPTGCGKTFSVFIGAIIDFINTHPGNYLSIKNNGLQLIWITPLRALAKDIQRAMEEVITGNWVCNGVLVQEMGIHLSSERQKQKRHMPESINHYSRKHAPVTGTKGLC